MNGHALDVLELPRVLALVAGRAASDPGRDAVLALRPGTDAPALRRELDRVAQTMAFLQESPGWGPPPIPDVRAALRRLAVQGSVLDPGELFRVGILLGSGRELGLELDRRSGLYPALAPLRALLHANEELEGVIGRSVEADGTVVDGASRELKRIRGELKRAHGRIVKQLEAYIRSLPERVQVADASVTIREGRYVIPVRREGKGEVGGIVHDESGTGATVFMEPPIAIRLMNELRDLELDEAREVQRILREITGRLSPEGDALLGSQEALIDFDSLQARARMGLAWRAEKPELLDPGAGELEVVGGRHPLLLAKEEDVVPFDLRLDAGERAMVVSGPNTGGKSVFLKALGLHAALAQSGVIPPVGAGTRLPVFRSIFADIGDEQSIAESLSTFSAHLANLREIVTDADGTSLVLIDEMGTGTDPTEGAALARAILETLVERGALAVVTSHLGQLKTLDGEGSGVVNASLQFDPDRMEPTYRLVKGRPGRSYGLAIARRLGFPSAVLDRAEGHVSAGEASVEDLLETLERKEKEAAGLVDDLARERAEATRLREELQARESQLREQERSAERRSREDARRLLLEAREEVEEAIREFRGAAAGEDDVEEVGRRARRRVEEAARQQQERSPRAGVDGPSPDLSEGQRVRLPGGQLGVVAEVRDGRAVVEVGGLRMELPAFELEEVQGGGAPPSGRPRGGRRASVRAAAGGADREPRSPDTGGWSGPESDARGEVDLRGLRVDEVELELGRALDGAVLGDLPELLVIHGKGTGAVRARVEELLALDGRVREFRLGRPGEGGGGVTVATLA